MEPTFASLCRLLHALEARRSQPGSQITAREQMLEKFFRRHVPVGTGSAAAVLALLLPTEDDRRYWLKETRLAGALVIALGLQPSVGAGKRLVEWQAGDEANDANDTDGRRPMGSGDLSELVARLVDERVASRAAGLPPLSVNEVDADLDALADHDGTALCRMLQRCSPLEAKWLVRIVLRDVQIGAELNWTDPRKAEWPRLVMDVFCPGLYTFFLRQRDLRDAAGRAEQARRMRAAMAPGGDGGGGGGVHVHGRDPAKARGGPLDAHVRHGVYVSVMNSSACTNVAKPAATFGGDDAEMVVETKYDGERLQLHMWPEPGLPDVWPTEGKPACRQNGVAWRVFSRGGNDSTYRRSLALPRLAAALGHTLVEPTGRTVPPLPPPPHPRVTSCILDGEIVVYDEDANGSRGAIEAFTARGGVQAMAPNRLGPGRQALRGGRRHPLVLLFDAIECDGHDFLTARASLRVRRAALRGAVRLPIKGHVEVVEGAVLRCGDRAAILRMVSDVTRRRGTPAWGSNPEPADSLNLPLTRSHPTPEQRRASCEPRHAAQPRTLPLPIHRAPRAPRAPRARCWTTQAAPSLVSSAQHQAPRRAIRAQRPPRVAQAQDAGHPRPRRHDHGGADRRPLRHRPRGRCARRVVLRRAAQPARRQHVGGGASVGLALQQRDWPTEGVDNTTVGRLPWCGLPGCLTCVLHAGRPLT